MTKRSLGLLVVAALLMIAASLDVEYETTRALDSPIVRRTVRSLQEGRPEVAALGFGVPSSYGPNERSDEHSKVETAFRVLEESFGWPAGAEPHPGDVVSYEVSIGSGPGPGWWESEPGFREARRYVYEASFPRLGSGYLLILTALSEEERVVSVSFALPAGDRHARERVSRAFSQLLHEWKVPEDHPIRRRDLSVTRTPPVPRQ